MAGTSDASGGASAPAGGMSPSGIPLTGPARLDAMSTVLARNWWLVALRGVFAILFGIAALVAPAAFVLSLVLFFAAYMLVDGIFGIVAAVLGVVKTMGSIDKPPAILGGMIGSALVGTFLGVLLAYGLVGPIANRLKQVIDADAAIYHVVKQIIIASLHGHPQPLVIEAARSGIAHKNQPGFAEVFDGLRGR